MNQISVIALITMITSEVFAVNENHCADLDPTNDFDEEALLGSWFIREYIYHKDNSTRTDYNPYCPTIQIRKLEDYVAGGLLNRNLVCLFILLPINNDNITIVEVSTYSTIKEQIESSSSSFTF